VRGYDRHMTTPLLGLGISALLLTVIHPPFGLASLAWIAYVPFILACNPMIPRRSLGLAAYGLGFLYWLVNLYWLIPVTALGWIAFCLYMALLWPLMALTLHYGRQKNIPLFIVTAVAVVGIERLQGFPLGGFFWRFLGHSQFQNPTQIQIADLFGAAGVSFVIAMVNGLVADLLMATYQSRLMRASNLAKALLVGSVFIGTILYGRWRIDETDTSTYPGPQVAAVQSNVPQSVKRSFQASEEIFTDLMQMSRAATQAGAELVVWPETTVQAILDDKIWPFEDPMRSDFDKALKEHAKGHANVLVGAYGGKPKQDDQGEWFLDRFNSAFLYRPDGSQDPQRYDKIHLVLFGEYLPFKNSFKGLYNLLMKCTPYNYDYTLEPGQECIVFNIDSNPPTMPPYRFGVIICYEDTVPWLVRQSVLDRQGHKRVDWLLNISNDGWFVRFSGQPAKVQPSAELTQHVAVCTFRAVENRVPILRSVNTGISCLIDSCGRIHNGFEGSSPGFPVKALERTGIAGWFADRMPIDRRVTAFSRYGRLLDNLCAIVLTIGFLLAWARHVGVRRMEHRPIRNGKR
jgi:apolipoprotein N-acyltransferase